MIMIDLMIRSNFTYRPSQDEWCEFWVTMRDDELAVNDPFVNEIYAVWHQGKTPSPRQMYFLFKRVFPKAKLGVPPPKKNAPKLSEFDINDLD